MNVQNVRARGEPGKADDISAISGSNRLTFLAAEIKNEHKAVSAALQRGVIHAMNAGDLLIEAKAHLKHGQWLPWVAKNCAFSERTISALHQTGEAPGRPSRRRWQIRNGRCGFDLQ